MTGRVVFLDRASVRATVRAPALGTYVEYPATGAAEVVSRLAGASVAITNKVLLRDEDLERLPDLRLIAVAATGCDIVDLDSCRRRGIAVCNIRNYAIRTVPEHAFGLILALRRNLLAYHADVERGAWQHATQFCLLTHEIGDLHGSTLGIIGNGAIGRALGAIGVAFGMRIIYADHPQRRVSDLDFRPLRELLATSDVVSLHCPLTPANRHMISVAQFQVMRPTALLINTARGGLVDEVALVAALDEGRIAGAGIDVLSEEPPRSGNPLLLRHRPNLIVTPHVAWASTAAMQALADQLIENIDLWASGRPRHLVV